MKPVARRRCKLAAVAVGGAAVAAVCSSRSSVPLAVGFGGAFGTVPAAASGAQHAGTVTWAEVPGSGPTWILPLETAGTAGTNNGSEFEFQMWRPLYWFGNGVEPTESP